LARTRNFLARIIKQRALHHRLPWIGLVNFAAGWTIVGWIAALVWSVTAIRQPAVITRTGSTALRNAQPVAA